MKVGIGGGQSGTAMSYQTIWQRIQHKVICGHATYKAFGKLHVYISNTEQLS